jgi:long-chain acyl-CoA synthetase
MSEEDRALLEDPAARRVWNWFAVRYADKNLTPATSPQLDLGIDSLEWLTVTLELGTETGVELDEAVIAEIDTIRDILRLVAEGQAEEQAVHHIQPLDDPEGALSEEQKKWLRPLGPLMSLAAVGLYVLNWILIRVLFRLRVEGAENVPEGMQVVLTPNHASYADAFVLASALKLRFLRATHWAGWTGIAFANPVARFGSRLVQGVPIDADHALVSSLALGAGVLKSGKNLIWFPEGRRTLTGELLPFKPGIGLLLHHFAVPVIPVYLEGTRQALPPGSWFPRPVRVTVRFGKPVAPGILEQEGEGSGYPERIATALRMHVGDLRRPQPKSVMATDVKAASPR